MEGQELIDKRQHQRFKVKERIFVEFSSRPVKVGEMIDISAGGLSFRYLANGDAVKKAFEIKIYFSQGSFTTDKMPVQTVSDFVINPEFPAGLTKIRRRGVCFQELGEDQKSQLEYFIRHHTLGEA